MIDRLLLFRDQCEKIEKHNGITNYKFDKKDAQWILDELDIKGTIVGGNFFSTPNPFIVHTDTGKKSENNTPSHNIVIPLTSEKDHYTVIFKQTYDGDAAHFMVGSVYKYWPDPVYNIRKDNYNDVQNLNWMDQENYFKYLTHLPWETIKKLSIEKIVKWEIGVPIIFESKQLHCSANFCKRKEGLTLLIAS